MKLFHVRKFFYWNTLTLSHEFCLIYINIILIQHILHNAVEYNEVELRLESIKRSPPLFFYYNMQKYDRQGSYYAELLSSLEVNYPSLKDQLSKTGKSIQAQSRHPHRATIVMREEQAIKRDAKSAGGITRLLSTKTVLKRIFFLYLWISY